MLPVEGELLHVSEDPAIVRFVPRRAADLALLGGADRFRPVDPADDLGPFWHAVRCSTLVFSGIRLANADPAV